MFLATEFIYIEDAEIIDIQSINDDIISKEIIPMIKKVAKKNKLPVIDLHSAMDGMPELFPDHIHPNEEGAKVMAKAVYDAIKK